jgi:LuxR family maltose regulon positive regulatory protein
MGAPEAQRTASPAASGLPPLPLLTTKLALPAPSAVLVSRARPTARLQPTPTCRLAFLVAPAGSGKSSLVRQWCQQHAAARVAWLSLDASDNVQPVLGPRRKNAIRLRAPAGTGEDRF